VFEAGRTSFVADDGIRLPESFGSHARRPAGLAAGAFAPSPAPTNTEGVGETIRLADALCRHPNRGALERLLIAHHPTTRTGPYDAIFGS